MHLECIDTKINMADMFTKSLPRLMFYRHVDYLLGHIPPKYSPVYSSLVGTYSDANMDTATCVPTSYTTPITAAAARVCAPFFDDYAENPWAVVLWHGSYNPSLHLGLWGGGYCRYVDKIGSNTILLLSSIPCHWIGTMGH